MALVEPEPQPERQRDPQATSREEPIDHLELVTVFAAGSPALVAVAESILRSADIQYMKRNEDVQDVLGGGRFPGGVNIFAGPVELLVSALDASEAAALLADVAPADPESDLYDDTGDGEEASD